jgi:hypothetical protein
MTANHNLDRRIADYYASEPPLRAPDWVLRAALETIDITPQRRGLLAPWRFQSMSTYAKLATAVVVVIAVGAIGLWQLAPPGPGGAPSATPIATSSPTPAATPAPTFPPAPTPTPYVPPALTETFTSDIHGFSISYPAGWATQAATAPWTDAGFTNFLLPQGDFLYDPVRTDHLFLEAASQPLGGASFAEWSAAMLAPEPDCAATEPVVVDGADGVLSVCNWALVARDGRGYLFALYTSSDDADLQSFDGQVWFDEILATVQLRPEDAIDTVPSASP